ncbi:hypothetical protein CH92_09345 [Stutzerimonas stutzeri]|uniref:Uncharacterized protein n=1 Tax=Stutzerimonas stutzeri TaxID=316 RepID=W8RZQ3_STUST|nr:hypothetical protein [Stutzerimonas stutzeri]AHL77626.1 hypothetical protein CH92_09345 [Stutzerimonas stutzeri]MCQ4328141.1 hypothetical protein [Stutzerimonas stutzeri]
MSVPVDPVSKEDGFEHHDANVKVLLIIGFGIFATLLVAGLGVAGLLWWYDLQPDKPVSALERRTEKPPEPRLESDPRAGGNEVIAMGRDLIEHYGWIDRDAGLARIPVDRGISLLAQRGWPSRAEPEPGETTPPREQQARERAKP